jgi:hypothetical protein
MLEDLAKPHQQHGLSAYTFHVLQAGLLTCPQQWILLCIAHDNAVAYRITIAMHQYVQSKSV